MKKKTPNKKKVIKNIEEFKAEYFPKDVVMDLLNRVRMLEIEVASLRARDIFPSYPYIPKYPYYPFSPIVYCSTNTTGEIK